jgi:hypothetical protein
VTVIVENDKVVAIGETGLDFHYNFSKQPAQKEIFRQELELAAELNLPVIVHSRNAFDETMEILKPFEGKLKRVVFHCFGGNAEQIADRIIRARREKPFKSVQDLRDQLYGDVASLDRAEPYIDVKSNFFLIRITAHCGNAKVTAAAAVIKENKTVERLIVLYGR